MSVLFRYLRFRLEFFIKILSFTTLFLAAMQLLTYKWPLIVFYLAGFVGYRWLLQTINPQMNWQSLFKQVKTPDFLADPPKGELSELEAAQLTKWQWQLAFLFGFILGAPALLGVWYLALAGFAVGFFSLFLLLRVYLHFSQKQARKIVAYHEKQRCK